MAKKKLSQEEKDKVLFIIENIDKVESISELSNLLHESIHFQDLKSTRKELNHKKKNYIDLKRHYVNMDDFMQASYYHQKELEMKRKLHQLESISKNSVEQLMDTSLELDEEKDSSSLRRIIINNILMLDFYYDPKDEGLFQDYLEENDYEKKMDILKQLRDRYLAFTMISYNEKKNVIHKIYKELSKKYFLGNNYKRHKQEFSDLLSLNENEDYKDKISSVRRVYRKSKIFLSELERLIVLERNEYKNRFPKKDYDDSETDYFELVKQNFSFYKEYVQTLQDIKYGGYSRKYGVLLEKFIPKEIEKLFEKLERLDEKGKEELALLGKDVCKNKLKNLKFGKNVYDDAERKFLKELISRFDSLRPMKPYEKIEDTSVYYRMMESFIDDDRNYSYIEKLLDTNPSFLSARKEKEHILMLLIDKFIFNYKLKLVNQGFSYVEPDFYKEVMKLYLSRDSVLSDEEKKLFYQRLDEFDAYCHEKKYASNKDVFRDLEELRECKTISKISIDRDKATMELGSILGYKLDEVLGYYLKKGMKFYREGEYCHTFMFDHIDHLAFSLEYTERGDTIFGVHMLDISKVVDMDDEIVKSSLVGKNLLPKLSLNREYPVMSFTYRLLGDKGMIAPVRIDPGVLRVDHVFREDDLDKYREIEELKNMYHFLHLFCEEEVNLYQQEGIDTVVSHKISDDLAQMFDKAHIPFIYEVHSDSSLDLIRKNHNLVCCELSKIPKKEAHQIFNILDQELDSYYMPIYKENSRVCLDSTKLEGVYLLHVLNQILSSKYDISSEAELVDNTISLLNDTKKYIPEKIRLESDKKLFHIVREYKRS